MTSFSLSTIAVTHNNANYIGRYLLYTLVPEVERLSGEVIVVDNRSDDESAAIAHQYPSVQLQISTIQQGFSANNNYGIALAKGLYLPLLKPDTEVQSRTLETLIYFNLMWDALKLCNSS
jgi:N-acetylglucosaminyl-diphospho-decaprenol L-rhamnosyltransferase